MLLYKISSQEQKEISLLLNQSKYTPAGVIIIVGRQRRASDEGYRHVKYFVQSNIYDSPLSLRNFFLGYEGGRVFSAGVGPYSPSRDITN